MSNDQAVGPDSQHLAVLVDEPDGPIDYLQERNQDALRAWRMRLAGDSAGVSADPHQVPYRDRRERPSPGAWR
jgi:hypothetical protein